MPRLPSEVVGCRTPQTATCRGRPFLPQPGTATTPVARLPTATTHIRRFTIRLRVSAARRPRIMPVLVRARTHEHHDIARGLGAPVLARPRSGALIDAH